MNFILYKGRKKNIKRVAKTHRHYTKTIKNSKLRDIDKGMTWKFLHRSGLKINITWIKKAIRWRWSMSFALGKVYLWGWLGLTWNCGAVKCCCRDFLMSYLNLKIGYLILCLLPCLYFRPMRRPNCRNFRRSALRCMYLEWNQDLGNCY